MIPKIFAQLGLGNPLVASLFGWPEIEALSPDNCLGHSQTRSGQRRSFRRRPKKNILDRTSRERPSSYLEKRSWAATILRRLSLKTSSAIFISYLGGRKTGGGGNGCTITLGAGAGPGAESLVAWACVLAASSCSSASAISANLMV
jgi:hypothetical protein